MICANCQSDNSPDAQYCFACGAPLHAALPPPALSYGYAQPATTSTAPMAIFSLALGILGLVLCGPLAIAAVICGHVAQRAIRDSHGLLKGKEIAVVGLVLGYLTCALWIGVLGFGAFVYYISVKDIPGNEKNVIRAIEQINDAEKRYAETHKNANGDPVYSPDLATLGSGPSGKCDDSKYACLLSGPLTQLECESGRWCRYHGYWLFTSSYVVDDRAEYVVTAIPAEATQGRRNFCSMSDAAVRGEAASLARTEYGPRQCGGVTPLTNSH